MAANPMKYNGGAPLNPAPIAPQPQTDNWPRLMRVNGDPSFDGSTWRNPDAASSPPEGDGPIGIFSGKPMRFMSAPIFDLLSRSGAGGDQNRPNALDDLLRGYARPRPSPFDAGVASPQMAKIPSALERASLLRQTGSAMC
jgi:hypothetical protein